MNLESSQILEEFEDRNIVKLLCWEDLVVYTVADEKEPFTVFSIIRYKNGEEKDILTKVGLIAHFAEGSKLILLGRQSKPELFLHDYVYICENGNLRSLTDGYGLNNTGHVSAEIWAAEGESTSKLFGGYLYFKSGVGGRVKLETINLSTMQKQTLVNSSVTTTFDASATGKVACVHLSDQLPAEVYVFDGSNSK